MCQNLNKLLKKETLMQITSLCNPELYLSENGVLSDTKVSRALCLAVFGSLSVIFFHYRVLNQQTSRSRVLSPKQTRIA